MDGPDSLTASDRAYAREAVTRLRANPRDPDATFARAAILAALGRRAEAVVALDALARVAPHHPGLWRLKARLFQEIGDPRMERLCRRVADREDARWTS